MKNIKIYLASQSPRRRELLSQMDVAFDILHVDVPEQRQPDEQPADYVQRLALEKAQAGVQVAQENRPVLGSDTIVVIDNKVLEKPLDKDHALAMLTRLSGRAHQVMTAVALAERTHSQVELVTTQVWFRELSLAEMETYWLSGEPKDKAGSYGIQGLAGKFVSRIEGSYSAVVGLPMMETDQLIQSFVGQYKS